MPFIDKIKENKGLLSGFMILGMLTFGSLNTICQKMQFSTCVLSLAWSSADEKDYLNAHASCEQMGHDFILFNKPWTQNFFMFIGESTLLIVYALTKKKAPVESDASTPQPKKVPFYVFGLPASMDVIGSGLGSLAMTMISAAVWQMMRGSVIIFTALFTVFLLKRNLRAYHWVAVLVTIVGLTLVGSAAVLNEMYGSNASKSDSTNAHKTIIGLLLTIGAQVCAAFQMTFEEKLLTGHDVKATKAVGMEGVWGLLMMICIITVFNFVPGPDHGVQQSIPDTFYVLGTNHMLLFWFLLFTASIAIYNFLGLTVSKHMSAVTRCLVDACRTIVIWAIGLISWYAGNQQRPGIGEPWQKYSYLQAIGFVFLVLGTLCYNAILKLPFLDYSERPTVVEATKPSRLPGTRPSLYHFMKSSWRNRNSGSPEKDDESPKETELVEAVHDAPAH